MAMEDDLKRRADVKVVPQQFEQQRNVRASRGLSVLFKLFSCRSSSDVFIAIRSAIDSSPGQELNSTMIDVVFRSDPLPCRVCWTRKPGKCEMRNKDFRSPT